MGECPCTLLQHQANYNLIAEIDYHLLACCSFEVIIAATYTSTTVRDSLGKLVADPEGKTLSLDRHAWILVRRGCFVSHLSFLDTIPPLQWVMTFTKWSVSQN